LELRRRRGTRRVSRRREEGREGIGRWRSKVEEELPD